MKKKVDEALLDELYSEVAQRFQRDVARFWDAWQRPTEYKTIIPRFAAYARAVGSVEEFRDYLERKGIVRIVVSLKNKQYVYPPESVCHIDTDGMLDQITELERLRHEELAMNKARRQEILRGR